MSTPAVQDDASPDAQDDASLDADTANALLVLVGNKQTAYLTGLKADCDAVGEKYPDYILKDRAAPVSSRRTDARRRC